MDRCYDFPSTNSPLFVCVTFATTFARKLVTTVETVGDITAGYEVLNLNTDTVEYTNSIQGGLTADTASSLLASLFTTMPNTTFSQNNGVVALTKCASRRAGYACGWWLFFLGVFSKVCWYHYIYPGLCNWWNDDLPLCKCACFWHNLDEIAWIAQSPCQIHHGVVARHWSWCDSVALCLSRYACQRLYGKLLEVRRLQRNNEGDS